MKNRGGLGVTCHNLSEKTGKLCGIRAVSDEDDLMMITDGGTIIRTPAADIPSYSRTAGGVILMRLGEGQTLVNFTAVAHEGPEEEELAEDMGVEAVAEQEAPETEN